MKKLFASLTVFFSLLGMVVPAWGTPFYEARVQAGTPPRIAGFGGVNQSPLGAQISDTFNVEYAGFPNRIDAGSGIAEANSGRLEAAVNAIHKFTAGEAREVNASAEFRVDDVVFSSPSSEPIDLTLPLHFSGHMNNNDPLFGTANVRVEIELNGQDRAGNASSHADPTGVLRQFNTGVLNGTLIAEFTDVPVNTPTTLRMMLSTTVFVNDNTSAFSTFDSTFRFVIGGPAFLVPAGVNVNSAQASIFDNRYTIPEPPSVLLVGLGIAVVTVTRRTCPGDRDLSVPIAMPSVAS